ncbi:MAG: futalosine hydrolase [Frankiaceae bacterium]|nr:futalosine hydrolase [Frankiaceae bacterium]
MVTAVEAERDAVLAGLADAGFGAEEARTQLIGPLPLVTVAGPGGCSIAVVAGGVGPAAAAASTATVLAALDELPDLVVSAGIAGAFAGRAEIGDLVVADVFAAADLGADSDEGFLDLDTLGFGSSTLPAVVLELFVPGLSTAIVGPVLTVSTATGSDARAADLARRHGAVAEAMEGFGVATAARLHQLPAAELRGISNRVGRRDRAAWDVPTALAAVRRGAAGLAALTRTGGRP